MPPAMRVSADFGDAVHGRRGGGDAFQRIVIQLRALEAVGIFLGDEGGGDVAR